MPPRKKARVSQATSPNPEPAPKSSPTPAAENLSKTDEDALLHDPWTDNEEIGLFKGLMRWKPTGIHKHFRLLALHAWLLENDYIHPRNAHTNPAGIWAKLSTLYDLSALDAREDARQLSPLTVDAEQEAAEAEDASEDADVYSVAVNKIENDDFDLSMVDSDFSQMMWKARFTNENDAGSEPELPELNMADEPPICFTPSFSIEPNEIVSRGKRSMGTKAPRGKKGQTPTAASRRSSRRPDSVADQDEGEEEAEEDEEVEEVEDEGQSANEEVAEREEEEEEEDQSEASTPALRRGRLPRQSRGKGAVRARGRGRGRGK